MCADCAQTTYNWDAVLRGFVEGGPALRAYLRYQEKVEDGTFREGAEIQLEEIM